MQRGCVTETQAAQMWHLRYALMGVFHFNGTELSWVTTPFLWENVSIFKTPVPQKAVGMEQAML